MFILLLPVSTTSVFCNSMFLVVPFLYGLFLPLCDPASEPPDPASEFDPPNMVDYMSEAPLNLSFFSVKAVAVVITSGTVKLSLSDLAF